MINPRYIYTFISICIIIIVGVFIRISTIIKFPSEMDDHIVASSIIRSQRPLNISSIKISIYDSSKSTFNSTPKRLLRTIDRYGELNTFLNIIEPIIPFFSVSNETTYAPFQFFFTKFLISNDNNLKENLFYGRLPSFVLSILSLFLFLIIIIKYLNGNYIEFGFIYAPLILFYSYEFAIYSVQMESYAIGVFGLFILILSLIKYLNSNGFDKLRHSIFFGLICGILVYFQYQILFFVVASYSTILYVLLKMKKLNLKVLINGTFSVISFIFIFSPLYFLFLSKHTNHVKENISLGLKSEYSFLTYSHTSILEYLENLIIYFFHSSIEVFRYMTMIFSINSFPELLFLTLNTVFFISGVVYSFRSKKYIISLFKIFTIFSIIIWFVLIVLGLINLSPDRHSLILLPFFVIYIFLGTRLVSTKYFSGNHIGVFYISFLMLFSYFFMNNHQIYFNDRNEPYLSQKFTQFMYKYNPNLIVARDQIIYLMPELYNETAVYFLSPDRSRSEWLTPQVCCKEPNYIALIGDSGTEYLEENIPDEVICKLVLHNLQFEDKYKCVDSIRIRSKTDEVNDKFTRWIDLNVKIYKKVL